MSDKKNNVIPFPGKKRVSKPEASPADFRNFVHAVTTSDLVQATAILATLLDLEQALAGRATTWFSDQFQADPGFIQQAMQLRHVVSSGAMNNGLLAIHQIFGLQGPDALKVYVKLRDLMAENQRAPS